MLAHVLLLHDLYNLFGHHVVIVLFWVFFTLKIHGRKYLMAASDRLEIWSINAAS